jgi:glucan phosphoethanolaminetransferase (alkaline phosphatase superfamily)
VPAGLGLVLDLAERGASPIDARYVASLALSAAFWGGPLVLAARLLASRATTARIACAAIFAFWILPLVSFAYGGQALYWRVFHSYVARDTVLLGIALRGTVAEWLSQIGGAWGIGAIGAVVTAAFAVLTSRVAPVFDGFRRGAAVVASSMAAFAIAIACFWFDVLETRGEQRATPDACFAHGVVHAARERLTGKVVRPVASMRTPAALPTMPRAGHRPNVLLVITESVRADALCSDPPPDCKARFLDDVAPDRIPLGLLTTQTPGTVSACVLLWTGLSPDADFSTMHAAPTIWEIARANGYATAYISAQNLKGADFDAFLSRAGVDVRVSGMDLGGVDSILTGAPDERATERTLAFVREVPDTTPWLAVMHLSNTHSPYRTDPELEPNMPHTSLPLGGFDAMHNHYRNSVLLQERTFSSFLRELRGSPRWDDTIVVFVSDHGEQFGEHGALYHLHNLYEEELRIPGFVVAGERALDESQRAALRTFAGHRTFTQDVNATLRDLVGAGDITLPFASKTKGRSMLRARPDEEPTATVALTTAVWLSDADWRGTIRGDRVSLEIPGKGRVCFDLAEDPKEKSPIGCE